MAENTDIKDFLSKDPNLVITNQGNRVLVDYYLLDPIKDNANYIQLLQVLNTLTPNDEIVIHISSPGGNVDTALQIVSAIKMCDALVITRAEGLCASAATFVWLAGQNIYATPYSNFLFHTCTYCNWGKFNEVKEYGKFFESWFEKTIRDLYKGFLTEEEITQMNDGKDFWFSSEEAIERLKRSKEMENRIDSLIDNLSERYKESLINEVNKIYDEDGDVIESKLEELEKTLVDDVTPVVKKRKNK